MVRRHKEEEIAGVIEFAGRETDDPVLLGWLAEHRARNGGKIRVAKGGTGTRVIFAKAADMAFWQDRSDKLDKAGRKQA